MAYAIRHPGHPSKLILASTAAKMRFDRSLEVFERLGGGEVREIARRFFENPTQPVMAEYIRSCLPLYNQRPQNQEWIARSVQHMELTSFFFNGEIRRFDMLAELAKIRCPTLITAGDLDPITPIQNAEDIAAAIAPGLARLERFKNTGHGCQRDDPEKFFRIVREFLLS